jgi:hypothetical protein
LAVKERCDGYFRSAKFFGNRLKGEGLGGFGIKEGLGRDGKTVDEGALYI